MLTANQNFNEFKYGVRLQGQNTSVQAFYSTLVASTTGNVAVNVLQSTGTTVFLTPGTITGFIVSLGVAAQGTFVLWGTTAGTIATIPVAPGTYAYIGYTVGTSVLNASVAAGDTVQVSSAGNSGTATCYVTFQAVA